MRLGKKLKLVIPAKPTVIPAKPPVIPAKPPVIPAKAGIQNIDSRLRGNDIRKNRNDIRKNKLLLLVLAVYFIFSFFTASQYLYNWDAGQLALGTERFSLQEHQPHPPGYFLYVQAGKFLNLFFADINFSFVFINIIAGAFAVFFLYKFVYLLTGKAMVSAWVSTLFAVNPVFWFYRSIASTYVFEALIVSFLSYVTYLSISRKKSFLPLSVFISAVLAGFRPSIIIIALPFIFIQIFYAPKKIISLLKAILAGILGLALWLPFFVNISGGWGELSEMIVSQVIVAKNTNVYDINHQNFLFLSVVFALHLPILLIFLYIKKFWAFIVRYRLFFILIAFVWQVLVYLFLHFGEVGYILAIIPLFYLFIAPFILYLNKNKVLRVGLIIFMAVEIFIFFNGIFFVKHHKLQPISYKNIKIHDIRLKTHIDFIKKYNPKTTLIIVLRGQYLNPQKAVSSYPYDDIRALGYYLPEYKLYDILGVKDLYFTAENFRYSKYDRSKIFIPPEKKNVIFLADYINPDMLPQGIKISPSYKEVSPYNIYFGKFESNEFIYNGIKFTKL